MSRTDALTYNVAGLLAEGLGSQRTCGLDGVTLDLDDLRQSQPLEGRIRLTRTNRGLVVDVHAKTSVEGSCSRCLRPIEVPISIELEEEALPSIDLTSGAPVDTEEEPDVLRLNDHHELDLEDEVREAIQLAEPIAPLCRPDCPGLCPTCGEELASGPHEHGPEAVDPRLAALQQFRVDGERKPD